MFRILSTSSRALALTAFGIVAGTSLSVEPANAAVYCRAVGVPKGCIARPAPRVSARAVCCTAPGLPAGCVARPVAAGPVLVAAPAATTRVVYCKRRGIPKGCVMR